MKIMGITPYTRAAQPQQNKNVTFGYIHSPESAKIGTDKENTISPEERAKINAVEKLLPIWKMNFACQMQTPEYVLERLRKHDAVTLKAKDDKVKAKINKGFEETYDLLTYENLSKPNYLVDLQEEKWFGYFYNRLLACDDDRNGIEPINVKISEPEWTNWDEVHWRLR